MPKEKKTEPLKKVLVDEHNSTGDTIDRIRKLQRTTNALNYSSEDAKHERLYGPRTPRQKFLVGLKRIAVEFLQELSYWGIWLYKILFVITFNVAVIFFVLWLISII